MESLNKAVNKLLKHFRREPRRAGGRDDNKFEADFPIVNFCLLITSGSKRPSELSDSFLEGQRVRVAGGLLHWFVWNAKHRVHACANLTLKEEI
jgi:hypothetical protein